jgi:hypothetical protein
MDLALYFILRSKEQIDQLYSKPALASIQKEVSYLHPIYQEIIRASLFAVLATSGPQGMDASPRGDAPWFVEIEDDRT